MVGGQVQPAGEAQAVIDLGDREWSTHPAARRRWPRPLLALGYAVAVLLGLSASAVPAPLVLQPSWQLPGENTVAFGDVAFVIVGSSPPVVTAVARHSGEQLWRRDAWAPTGTATVTLTDLGSGLVATTEHSGIPIEEPVTEVVDAATGAVLHTLPGRMFAAVPQHGLVIIVKPVPLERAPGCHFPGCGKPEQPVVDPQTGQPEWHDVVPCEELPTCGDLIALDARSGAQRWRVPAVADRAAIWRERPGSGRDLSTYVTGLGVLDQRGHLMQYDLATGRVVRDTRMPFWDGSSTPADAVTRGDVAYVGDLLLEVTAGRQPAAVSAVHLTDGRVWSAALPSAGPLRARACGPAVCLGLDDYTLALNAGTGDVMGRGRFYGQVGAGDLLAWDPGLGGQRGVSIYDLASSEVRDTVLGDLQLVDRPGRRSLVVVFQRRLHRSDVYTITKQGRLSLAVVIDPARYCEAAADVLVCATEVDGVERIKAWQLPP